MWLDGNENITESGGFISSWGDRSGNNIDLNQSVGEDRPTLITNASIPPTISFNGTSSFLRSSADVGILNSTPFMVYAVVKNKSTSTDGDYLFDSDDPDTTTPQLHRALVSLSRNGKAHQYAGSWVNSNIALSEDSFHLITASFNGATSFIGVDGVYGATANAGIQTLTDGITLGTNHNNTLYFLDGEIGEFIIINALDTLADRERMEGYLAHKWDLASALPSSHPYKTNAPQQYPITIRDLEDFRDNNPAGTQLDCQPGDIFRCIDNFLVEFLPTQPKLFANTERDDNDTFSGDFMEAHGWFNWYPDPTTQSI